MYDTTHVTEQRPAEELPPPEDVDTDIRVVRVAPNETHCVEVASGVTLSHTCYDIRAPGAAIEIDAHGSDWELAHLAIVGAYDQNHGIAIRAEVPDSEGEATIRDIWMGDGNANATAIHIQPTHAGHIDIARIYAKAWTRAFDAAAPGAPNDTAAAGGTVTIGDCHAEETDAWSYRLGTKGSRAQNCVARDGGRCFWERWQRSSYKDCHARGIECWFAGNPENPTQLATAATDGCAGKGAKLTAGPGSVNGDIRSNPSLTPPDACPTTTEEALLGDGELARGQNMSEDDPFSFQDPE